MPDSESHVEQQAPVTPDPREGSRTLSRLANVFTVVRLVGAPLLLVPAFLERAVIFLTAYFLLLATDWFDGRLARWSGRHSPLGARLDSVADALLFLALLIGARLLWPDVVWEVAPWIAVVAVGYASGIGISLLRFRRMPGVHTWSAKCASHLLNAGLVATLLFDVTWPLKVALTFVIIANVESSTILLLLAAYRTDIPSIVHLLRSERRS